MAIQHCFAGNSSVFRCPNATCFCKPVWRDDEVHSIDGVTYSTKYGLGLRLFTPPFNGPRRDRRAKRPAIVAIHGGHFEGGNRNESGIVEWCIRWARVGIVAISIDYRLLWKQLGHPKDIMHAMWDARAAIRWLRMHETNLSLDSERIGAFGSSAGGMTAVYLGTVAGGEGDSGNPGYSSRVHAVATLSAARWPPPPGVSNVTAAEAAYLDFHGCADPFVPYDCTAPESQQRIPCFSAVTTNQQLRSAGAKAALYPFPGAGHVPFAAWASEAARRRSKTCVMNLPFAHA